MKHSTSSEAPMLTRRHAVGAIAAATALALAGCGPRRAQEDARDQTPASESSPPLTPAAASTAMTVYRDPSCGCCEAWGEIARKAGYQVKIVDHPDMPVIKRQYGVPEELLSCHTTAVGGYAVEGHVPIADVKRLLAERPAEVRGIAVPGMPAGSPGMEVPNGTKQPFQVMAFDAAGRISPFRA